MNWSNIQSIIANNYYRSGIPDEHRETIIELPSPEYLETISNIVEHWTELKGTTEDVGCFDFTKVNIPGLGKLRVMPGKEIKVFHKADLIFIPN